MLVLSNVTKKKGTTKCGNGTVICDISTANLMLEPLNVTKT